MTDPSQSSRTVFWHRELPPLDSEPMGDHVVEATSDRVPGSIERNGESWHRCYASLMAHTVERVEQELTRMGGHYAHVHDEHVESHRDDMANESWLRGRFNYVLYQRAG